MKIVFILLFLSFFLFCPPIQANTTDTFAEQEESGSTVLDTEKSLFEDVRELAARMEVFPVDIYASNGPLAAWTVFDKLCDNQLDDKVLSKNSHTSWRYRYELTFDRYIPMFEFKERVYRAKVKEIEDCLGRIEEMTPKEKALLLTALYIFECHWRPIPDRIRRMKETKQEKMIIVGTILTHKFDESIGQDVYDRWFAVAERYKNDTTVVFPAIDTPLEELKKEWEIHFEKCNQKIIAQWNLSAKPHFSYFDYREVFEAIKEKSPQEARLLSMYGEYFSIFDFRGKSGIEPYSGNSSVFPKTLGDIAMQILMSRYPYDPNHPEFGNPLIL